MQEKHSAARAWSTKQRDPTAAGDGDKADKEAVSQGVSRRFTRSDDETRAGSQPGSDLKV